MSHLQNTPTNDGNADDNTNCDESILDRCVAPKLLAHLLLPRSVSSKFRLTLFHEGADAFFVICGAAECALRVALFFELIGQ